ncbi:MAG: hemolysin family protein [Clostridiaceae bacterium]
MLIIFIAFSAFFSAAETALMSLSKIRIRHMVEEGVKGAKLVEKLTGDPNKLLGAILIGNNVCNIASSALATSFAVSVVGESGVGIATGVMTVLILIFAEITPKSFAKQKSEKVSLKVIGPINLLVIIFKPLVFLFSFISSFLVKILGGDTDKNQPFITQEELKTMMDVSEEEGVLEGEEKEMIFNVFEFGDIQVKDVMVQRVDIVAVGMESNYDEVIDVIKREQFSRIPVYKEDIDDIVGILYVKDLILLAEKDDFKVEDFIREPYYTFEFKKVTELFKEMKKSRNHMAVVLDEYGGTVGIVTIEDLLEEIVGEIDDEYDDLEEDIEVIKEDEYLVDGSMRLDDLSDLIGVSIESEEFDSIGGFVIGQLGRFPELNEDIEYQNMRLIVEEIDKNRIKKVRIFT